MWMYTVSLCDILHTHTHSHTHTHTHTHTYTHTHMLTLTYTYFMAVATTGRAGADSVQGTPRVLDEGGHHSGTVNKSEG